MGVASGAFPIDLLAALPARIINLLESDLLQALPLYVLMGLTLNRLPIAELLFRSGVALLGRRPSAPLVSGIALGALLGPMNGSVGASVMSLARAVAPRLEGLPKAERFAAVSVASTLGVVVPPSLVLILLGDAMLNAHTLAVTATGRADRVINTQDVFRGALVPAAIFLALCLAIAWWKGRRIKPAAADAKHIPLRRGEAVLALLSLAFLIVVLGGVAAGYFYAVEAAAMGAFVLFGAGIVTGRLRGQVLRELLHETMAITGALFGLLAAATTLTLIFRTFGTDKLLDQWITALPGGEIAVTLVVLGIIGLCAFVLDAFEIIFVLVPILIPPLLIRVPDAVWVSTLVLLDAAGELPAAAVRLRVDDGAHGAPRIPADPHDRARGGAVSTGATHRTRARTRLPCPRASPRHAGRQHPHLVGAGFGRRSRAAAAGNDGAARRGSLPAFAAMRIHAAR